VDFLKSYSDFRIVFEIRFLVRVIFLIFGQVEGTGQLWFDYM